MEDKHIKLWTFPIFFLSNSTNKSFEKPNWCKARYKNSAVDGWTEKLLKKFERKKITSGEHMVWGHNICYGTPLNLVEKKKRVPTLLLLHLGWHLMSGPEYSGCNTNLLIYATIGIIERIFSKLSFFCNRSGLCTTVPRHWLDCRRWNQRIVLIEVWTLLFSGKENDPHQDFFFSFYPFGSNVSTVPSEFRAWFKQNWSPKFYW